MVVSDTTIMIELTTALLTSEFGQVRGRSLSSTEVIIIRKRQVVGTWFVIRHIKRPRKGK